MKRILFLFFVAALSICGKAQVQNDDLDNDGKITKNDVTLLLNKYLSNEGNVTMHDVVLLIDKFVKNVAPSNSAANTHMGHEYVDLGTGVYWAKCNVGASSPEKSGYFFAWGEVSTKEVFDTDNYVYHRWDDTGGRHKLMWTKYCLDKFNGDVDNRTQLDIKDDAANANWHGGWRMPTMTEIVALREQCYWKHVDSYNGTGISGYIVFRAKDSADRGATGNDHVASYTLADAHIFLPAAGWCRGSSYWNTGGHYWSSSLYEKASYESGNAYDLSFSGGQIWASFGSAGGSRTNGFTVRAVCDLP